MGNVRSARSAGNGRDCLDEAEAPTIGHMGRFGERVGSSGGRRVGGTRLRGVGKQPSLPCDAQPGAGAAIRRCCLTPCPPCLGGNELTCAAIDVHGGFRQVVGPWDKSLLPLPIRREPFGRGRQQPAH